jgi:formyltetrahydrofolate synthetase
LPICIAKTQYSFSATDGQGSRLAFVSRYERFGRVGAGFLYPICGDVTVPGLSTRPDLTLILM